MRYSVEERQEDLRALLSAATPDDLHRVLALCQPACREREPINSPECGSPTAGAQTELNDERQSSLF